MSELVEYKVGEIFRAYGETLQCVSSESIHGRCSNCVLRHCGCYGIVCGGYNRSDNRWVHFVRVIEPKAGMLFRAQDGKLYKLMGECLGKCYHYINRSLCCCAEIHEQAFGYRFANNLHWYPVEESKEKQEEKAKMEEKEASQNRHIEISVVSVKEQTVTFRISQQTHRYEDFTPNGNEFKSSYGYFLVSQECPEYKECRDLLYVRGVDDYEDDNKITVPLSHFAKIMQAVTEYNDTNGAGYEKPWPQNGEICYFVSIGGLIDSFSFPDDSFGRRMKEFGNLFRTREEAESARERVKKALNGVE